MDHGSGGKTSIGFLLGVIVGGALGILFAPKSGKETREDIGDYLGEAEQRFKKKKDELRDASAGQLARVKKRVNDTFRSAKEMIERDSKDGESAGDD